MPREDGYVNLVPGNRRSRDESSANGRKGGVKSGVARRRKKALTEAIHLAWSCGVTLTDTARESLVRIGYDFETRGDPTAMDMTVAAIVAAAMEGDLAAAEFLARYGLIPDARTAVEAERMQKTYELEKQRLELDRERFEQEKAGGAASAPVILLRRPEGDATAP